MEQKQSASTFSDFKKVVEIFADDELKTELIKEGTSYNGWIGTGNKNLELN